MAQPKLSKTVNVVEASLQSPGGYRARSSDLVRGPRGGTFRRRREVVDVMADVADWLCVAAVPGREFVVADDLAALGFATFCPHGVRVQHRARVEGAPREKRACRERDYPVFGNYVFVGLPVGAGLRLVKRTHRDIVDVLDDGRVVVPRTFIAEASKLWKTGVWDMRTRDGVRFRRGASVAVNSGAFAGIIAEVERMRGLSRAVIAFALMGRTVHATVDSSVLDAL